MALEDYYNNSLWGLLRVYRWTVVCQNPSPLLNGTTGLCVLPPLQPRWLTGSWPHPQDQETVLFRRHSHSQLQISQRLVTVPGETSKLGCPTQTKGKGFTEISGLSLNTNKEGSAPAAGSHLTISGEWKTNLPEGKGRVGKTVQNHGECVNEPHSLPALPWAASIWD